MTDSQLSHPAFLLSLGGLSSSLAMRMGIDSIQHHSSLNWGPCILSLCPVFHAFCVFFLISIAFWVLLFTSIQFCIITWVQCPVSFIVLNVDFILWKQVTTPELSTREQTQIPKARCQLCILGTVFQNGRVSYQELKYHGPWRLQFGKLLKIRACFTIVSWLGDKHSFQSVLNRLECEWLWIIYCHGKQII